MTKERRKSENTALRELIDALKKVAMARDGLWSLSVIDRIFRLNKYRKTIADYDEAMQSVRNAIVAVMAATRHQSVENNLPLPKPGPKSGITLEEFEFLMGRPDNAKKTPGKAVKSETNTQ